jgi:ABC-type uncharacterized transport system fused permease/ATPase subunit
LDRPRLLAIIITLSVLNVYMAKLFNDWNARFYNSLQDKNAEAFWAELLYWVVLAAIFITAAVYRLYLSQLLTIRWRRWLSEVYFRDWLSDRTYYRMEIISAGTDNPEQRIEQDCSTVRHADAQPHGQPAAADHDADHLRDRCCGACRRASWCRSSAASPSPAT